jgi:hypothetical protein
MLSSCDSPELATGIIFSGTLRSLADPREDAVRKGAQGAWPIHYHMMFPVKYRKGLLDEAVTAIIQETAAEIHIHLLCSAHPKLTRTQQSRRFCSNERAGAFMSCIQAWRNSGTID